MQNFTENLKWFNTKQGRFIAHKVEGFHLLKELVLDEGCRKQSSLRNRLQFCMGTLPHK
jgi:hypothetical protein